MNNVLKRIRSALERLRGSREVRVDARDMEMLIDDYDRIDNALRDYVRPKPGDTKFFVVWDARHHEFMWYEKATVPVQQYGRLYIPGLEPQSYESSGFVVVRDDGQYGDLMKPQQIRHPPQFSWPRRRD